MTIKPTKPYYNGDTVYDECGRLKTQLARAQETIRAQSAALLDLTAFLGPTRAREFEKWREKRT